MSNITFRKLLELWDLESECGDFKFNTERNWQLLKLVKQWRNMIRSLGWQINCTSKGILNYLEAIYGRFWYSIREWITIINFRYNQWICKDYSKGNIQRWSNLTKLFDLVICKFAYWRDVFSQWQATIKSTRFRADDKGEITLPRMTIEEDWILFRCWGLPIMRNSVVDDLPVLFWVV